MKIDHVAICVADLEAAKDFFILYFGAVSNDMYHNPRTGLKTYFLTFADGGALELMNYPGLTIRERKAEETGYVHLAFKVGSREAVDELTFRLGRAGYPVLSGPRLTGDGFYESCVAGPEGNRIEITV